MSDERASDPDLSGAISFRTGAATQDHRPYLVEIDMVASGRFDDLGDAIASAQISKRQRPMSRVVAIDRRTQHLLIEVET